MNEPKFTPGPWEATPEGYVFTQRGAPNADGVHADSNDSWLISVPDFEDCPGTRVIGEEVFLSESEQEANAHLKAAAPELYQELLDRYTQTRCGCGHPGCGRCRDDRDTEAVLARARGENVE